MSRPSSGVRARALVLGAAVAAAGTLGCRNPAAASSEALLVDAGAGALALRNRTGEPLYYFAAARDILPLLDWLPCTRPATCPSVPPDGMTLVPYDRIVGHGRDTETIVLFHWRLVPHAAGGFRPDSIRALVVPL